MHRKGTGHKLYNIIDALSLQKHNIKRFKVKKSKFVFCTDYIATNGQFMSQEVFPFVFLAPKSIKFELTALSLPFRKYIVLVPYQT